MPKIAEFKGLAVHLGMLPSKNGKALPKLCLHPFDLVWMTEL